MSAPKPPLANLCGRPRGLGRGPSCNGLIRRGFVESQSAAKRYARLEGELGVEMSALRLAESK